MRWRDVSVPDATASEALRSSMKGHPRDDVHEWPQADSGWMFTNTRRETFDPHIQRRTMQRLRERTGIRVIVTHGLRHTSASLSQMYGVLIEVVVRRHV